MLVLGLILILLAIAAGIAVTVNEPAVSTTVTVFDRAYELTATEMFVAGAVSAALFLLGCALLIRGSHRARARRTQLRHTRLEARERVARLEEEKRELERKLQDTSASPAPAGASGANAASADAPATAPPPRSASSDDQLVAGRRPARTTEGPPQH